MLVYLIRMDYYQLFKGCRSLDAASRRQTFKDRDERVGNKKKERISLRPPESLKILLKIKNRNGKGIGSIHPKAYRARTRIGRQQEEIATEVSRPIERIG